jgi:hypothetical protein
MKPSWVLNYSGYVGPAFASLTIRVFARSSAIALTAPVAPTATISSGHPRSSPLGTQPTAWLKLLLVTSPTGTERLNPHNRYPAA